MASDDWDQAVASIREMVLARDAAGVTDSQLLKLFLTDHDEAAFEAIVRRHGPMVLGVCKRVLQNATDADDAFQATFLILVRKATSLAQPELLGHWLYGVAYQTARAARSAANRRRVKEGQVSPKQGESAPNEWRDVLPILDAELNRLPAKYRAPIVLCDLQQKSRKEVAQALGLPEGTLASRLARAREHLAKRLTRRGVTLSGAAVAATLGETAAAPSAALVQLTVQAGTASIAGKSAALGIGSAKAIKLSETVLKMMLLNKLKLVSAFIMSCALLTAGVGTWTSQHGRSSAAAPDSPEGKDTANLPEAALADAKLFQPALDAAAAITEPKARLELLLRIASAQLRAGDRPGAVATTAQALTVARGLEVKLERFNAFLKIASFQNLAGQKAESRATARDAEKIDLSAPNPQRNSGAMENAIANLISLLSSWGEFDECLRIASTGKVNKRLALQSLAEGVSRSKETESAARQTLQKAAEMAVEPIPPGSKETNVNGGVRSVVIPPDGPLAAIAAARARIGSLKEAFETVEAMIDDSRDGLANSTYSFGKRNALTDIAKEQVLRGDYLGAKETAVKAGLPPSGKAIILRQIVDKQVKDGDFRAALQMSTELSSVQERANALCLIAAAQIEKKDIESARTTLDELRKLGELMQEDGGNSRRGAFGPRNPEVDPRVAVALTEARLGDFQAALLSASNLTLAIDKAQALCEIGSQLLVAGKREEAKTTLRRASRSAERIPDRQQQPNFSSRGGLRSPGTGRGGVGNPEVLNEMFSVLEKPALQREIARQQAKAGDVEGAFETAESLPPGMELYWLLIALADGGDLNGAVQSLAKLNSTTARTRALEGIARSMARAGKEQEASALAERQTNPLLKAYTLLGLAIGKTDHNETPGE
jgi:RNA polymerase sigma factor (sigma-70 family)